MGEVRVRFAPSPTGYLHIGGARTALFNWLYARHAGGKFILRIEDTDTDRSETRHLDAILDGLRWLGLDWDEGPGAGGDRGPYLQSERLPLYRAALEQLQAGGGVYPCFCTREELARQRAAAEQAGGAFRYPGACRNLTPAEREARVAAGAAPAWRLRLPVEAGTLDDLVHGPVPWDFAQYDDFIVWRSDGNPVYNFTVVVDDAGMGITHVLRGDDHLSNTPKQLAIYRALGLTPPRFGHIPLILGPDKKRLSKRHGATSVQAYRELGFLPEPLVNALALLGWSDEQSTQRFTRPELVAAFTIERVNPTAAVFDYEKMLWFNHQHLQRLPPAEKLAAVTAFLAATGVQPLPPPDRLAAALALVSDRFRLLSEAWDQLAWLLAAPAAELDPKALAVLRAPTASEAIRVALELLTKLETWTVPGIEGVLRGIAVRSGVAVNQVMQPVRVAISGRTATPGLFESLAFLGREETLRRLRTCLGRFPL